jgi:DNA polymerase III epsilon subunit-like protein
MPDFEKDMRKSIIWAQKLIAGEYGEWVVLDTETTGLYGAQLCEICVLSKYGSPMINTPVKPDCAVHEGARNVHKITDDELQSAPHFTQVYNRLKEVIDGKRVVIYNAGFDSEILFNMVKVCKLPRIKFKADCAMKQYSRFYGQWHDYWRNYTWQKLPGGSHRAYGDAYATYKLIHMMANHKIETVPEPLEDKLFPPLQVACKWEKFALIEFCINEPTRMGYEYYRSKKKLYLSYPKFHLMRAGSQEAYEHMQLYI